MYPGTEDDFHAPKTEITRPGWTANHNESCLNWSHPSGAIIAQPIFSDCGRPGYVVRGVAVAGGTVESNFTAAEKAIEESGWRPDGWGESVENTFLRQKGRGFRVDFFENRWIYTCGIGDAWHNAPSMVQAFALAEASDGT